MFKKIHLLILVGLLAMGFSFSCATFDKAAVENTKNVAVIAVYADKRLDASDFTGLGAAISALAQNKDFNMDSEVAKMKDDLFNEYSKAFSFKLMDEKAVLSSPNYSTVEMKQGILGIDETCFASAPGYRPFSMILRKPVTNVIRAIPGADAGLMLFSTYKLRKKFEMLGFGTAVIDANVELLIKDKNFKTVLYKIVSTSSKNTIKFALGGVFDAKQIQPLCAEATGTAASKMKEWLMKQYAK